MNIVYIHTHDTGRYLEPYGEAVKTPNLMEFAQEGTLFRNAYCVGPTCSPSRAGLLTGIMPHNNGMFGLAHRGFALKDYNQHLANYLKEFGYKTALCGIQHVAERDELIGYDYILRNKDKSISREARDELNAQEACNFIKNASDEPFFLSFGMWSTHREFPDQNSINPDYVKPPYPIVDTRENREDMARFMASATYMDSCFGKLYEAIKSAGIMDDTLIIFTTDHGIAFPHMKCNLYDTGIGVSLIMNYKGNQLKGEVCDSLISHLDIFPTICDLVDIPKPQWIQGYSIKPIFEKQADAIRKEVFAEVSYHAAYEPKRCVRTERFKLIRHYDDHHKIVPSNIDDSPAKSLLINHNYLGRTVARDMLFDLYHDPLERVNLANDEEYTGIYKELSDRLIQWQKETEDPIVSGHISKPNGAIVNRLDCISPGSKEYEVDGIR